MAKAKTKILNNWWHLTIGRVSGFIIVTRAGVPNFSKSRSAANDSHWLKWFKMQFSGFTGVHFFIIVNITIYEFVWWTGIKFMWDMLVGLDKHVDWVLPALRPHTQDIIKPWGKVSLIKVFPHLLQKKLFHLNLFEEIWVIDGSKTLGLYGIQKPTAPGFSLMVMTKSQIHLMKNGLWTDKKTIVKSSCSHCDICTCYLKFHRSLKAVFLHLRIVVVRTGSNRWGFLEEDKK